MTVERPLDLLNELKGKEVKVIFKTGKEIVGTLMNFDIHINLVLDNAEETNTGLIFIKGDDVSIVCPVKK